MKFQHDAFCSLLLDGMPCDCHLARISEKSNILKDACLIAIGLVVVTFFGLRDMLLGERADDGQWNE